jgi:hypothetical protein
VVLVLDQEDDDTLVQTILFGRHGMMRMGQHAGLEDGRQVLRVHPIVVRLGSKNREQIENVQKQLSIQRGQLCDEVLVSGDGIIHVEILDELGPFHVANGLSGSPS